MAWFKVDDKLHSHPKRHRAGLRAMGLWVVAGSWCGDQLTDGTIPRDMLAVLGGRPADASALVAAGMWEVCEEGWRFHDWAGQNPTRADVEGKRDHERNRKAEWRARKAELRSGDVSRIGPASVPRDMSHVSRDCPAGVPALSPLSRPDPTRPELKNYSKTLHGIDELVTRVTQTNAMP